MDAHSETTEELILEITRYLAAVDAFRAERCEPTWRPETPPAETPTGASVRGTHDLPSSRVH